MKDLELLKTFNSASILPDKIKPTYDVATKIMGSWLDYKSAGDPFGMPAWVVGIMHSELSDFDLSWLNEAPQIFEGFGVGPSFHWDIVNALKNLESFGCELWGYTNEGAADADKPGAVALILALKGMGASL